MKKRPTCRQCGGRLVVYSVHNTGKNRVRYYRCKECGKIPPRNKLIIPLAQLELRPYDDPEPEAIAASD